MDPREEPIYLDLWYHYPRMWIRLSGTGPLFRQVYGALRAEILERRLAPGTRLPATRDLARELRVSRNTVLQAYQQLLDEGYAAARTGSGTYVAETLPEDRVQVRGPRRAGGAPPTRLERRPAPPPALAARAERTLAAVPRDLVWGVPRRRLPYDFRYGEPAFGDLPLETWWRLAARRGRRASAAQLAYGPPAGAPELRTALAGYLRRARGVRCEPSQVIVVNGTQQATDLVLRVLVDPGDRVALEEPHYTGFSFALRAHGAEILSLPVDAEGLVTEALAGAPPFRGVFVTPSHQFPTGGILPLARRLQLLAAAEWRGAFVVEDDYDGEFRYDGRPIECLQGLDDGARVLYVGSTSKLLFPALRIGWLVVPEALAPAFSQAKALCDTGNATLEQLVLADFVAGGHLERHVRRSRARNAARRAALVAALARHLPDDAELLGTGAGLHGVLAIPGLPMRRESELRKACAERGVGLYPIAPYYLTRPPPRAAFLLGFSALDEKQIAEGVRRLAEALAAIL
jgi:GntR family transcriptional regulator / MocR family aminotransferase